MEEPNQTIVADVLTRHRGAPYAVLAVVLYIGAAWWGADLDRALWLQPITIGDAEANGLPAVLRPSLVYAPTALVLIAAVIPAWHVLSFRGVRWRRLAVLAGAAGLAGFMLDAYRIWPWAWRYDAGGSVGLADALIQTGQYAAIVAWFALWAVAIPVVEEVLFRGAFLRAIQTRTRSQVLAVAVSAIAFAAAHVGPTLAPSSASLINAFFACAFGVVSGMLVVQDHGRVHSAISLHVGHSATALVMMFAAA